MAAERSIDDLLADRGLGHRSAGTIGDQTWPLRSFVAPRAEAA